MEDTLISFPTAKLAKEKGFDEPVQNCFCENNINQLTEIVHIITYNFNNGCKDGYGLINYSRCTQSLLQKFLRDKHGIKVIVDTDITLFWIYNIQSLHPQASYTGITLYSKYVYSIYELALEEGLFEALKLIK